MVGLVILCCKECWADDVMQSCCLLSCCPVLRDFYCPCLGPLLVSQLTPCCAPVLSDTCLWRHVSPLLLICSPDLGGCSFQDLTVCTCHPSLQLYACSPTHFCAWVCALTCTRAHQQNPFFLGACTPSHSCRMCIAKQTLHKHTHLNMLAGVCRACGDNQQHGCIGVGFCSHHAPGVFCCFGSVPEMRLCFGLACASPACRYQLRHGATASAPCALQVIPGSYGHYFEQCTGRCAWGGFVRPLLGSWLPCAASGSEGVPCRRVLESQPLLFAQLSSLFTNAFRNSMLV
jgi:hypothetical protein